ncbi:AbiH family protein [Lactobacillus sp. PSON]|uniref:AbiH family protein n=1 Tax=Lactobacillus sp. PSON TaxID=3455454 RepID=UPI004043308B
MILFIVGNGLDRSLGLPIDYRNNLLSILEQMDTKKAEFISKVFFLDDEKLWSEFENNIGNIKDLHPKSKLSNH